MNEYALKRLALLLATQAEIDGMKAENERKKVVGDFPTHTEDSFKQMAEKLRWLAYAHDEQL